MKEKEHKQNRLSEYLVLVISKEELDQVAETFLKRYYPEALEKPMKVPARKMNGVKSSSPLEVVCVYFTLG